jgi:prolyl oligopeptidase
MSAPVDPFSWLEELDDERATGWVRERNAESTQTIATGNGFAELRDEIRQVLDSEDRIPMPSWNGEHLYNLWKDRDHPRGLWRRTTLAGYREPEPDWEVLLDVDALGREEGESWVFQSAILLRPGYQRALVHLSRGGSDANVVREFDLDRREFVADGFHVPEAKTDVSWINADRIYVLTDFGPGSLTSSGYPRTVKELSRGTTLATATRIYEGRPEDVTVFAWHDSTPGFPRDVVGRALDFYRHETYLRSSQGDLLHLDVPDDCDVELHREWLLIRLRSAWTPAGATFPPGTVLIAHLDAYIAGSRDLTVVFEPRPDTSLSYSMWTRNYLILVLLRDVRSVLEIFDPATNTRTPLVDTDFDEGHTDVVDTNSHHTDEFLLSTSGYTTPTTLRYGKVGGRIETLKQEPVHFDTGTVAVRQFFAVSADGTRVPYFVVGDPSAGPGPTLLSGYGGFEISRTPYYSGVIGRGWLSRGGTYVVANIRGGGEYGPDWHRAALRENRPRAYEDFAAVATDLINRGIATRSSLGVEGGSNGGLLTGVMLTSYPELFGAVVSQVPLLDMRRYHELLAGASWIAEYGNPDDEADWAYLQRFSPYHNVHSGRSYPPVLFVTSTRDDRVHPGHARKMVALMRQHGYDVTYYENIEGGHGAASDNGQLAYKWALVFAFLWRHLST